MVTLKFLSTEPNNAEQKARDKEMARMIDVSNFGVESYGAESSSSEEK